MLRAPAAVNTESVQFTDAPVSDPVTGEVLVRVRVEMCGVCRADLHVVEGELPPRKSPDANR